MKLVFMSQGRILVPRMRNKNKYKDLSRWLGHTKLLSSPLTAACGGVDVLGELVLFWVKEILDFSIEFWRETNDIIKLKHLALYLTHD